MNVTSSHPLTRATWVWPEAYMYLYNHFAQFRHDFELCEVPDTAPLFLTADKGYRLYINGRYVCRGPARGYQSHWPYDEVDVREYLRTGHNWFAVEAYTPGISTFQYLHLTKAGFICAAEWGDVRLVTNSSWLMRRAPAHKTDTARLSMQLDFQEDWNASADDRSWIVSEAPPSDWNKNYFTGPAQNMSTMPFGQPPWEGVEPRGIPMLREELVVPARVTARGMGECRGEYRDCRNISWHWVANECSTVKEWDTAPDVGARQTASALELTVEPAGQGRFRAITIDLGQQSVGTLNVEVEGGAGDEIVDFQYHQNLRKGIPDSPPPGGACMVALASRLRLAAGTSRHEFFHIMGIRHITVVVRDSLRPLKISLWWRTALYPFTMRGGFRCSDDVLNGIYESCRVTQQICAIDAYVDTSWREQAQWWGDARVQARNTFHLDGDARLLARGIRSIAGQMAPQGLTYGHAPTCSGWCILPDFSLTWILTVWDWYWQTGDLTLFREQHSRIKDVLRYFETPEARDEDGLLIEDKRFWLFEDWAPLPKDRVPVFLNLWHLYTLEHYAQLLQAAGLEKDLARVRQEIKRRRKLIVSKCYSARDGLFVACLDAQGQPVGEPSVHDQVLAVLLKLRPEAETAMLKKRLLPCLKDGKLTCAVPSAFWSTYWFDSLHELGHGAEVIDFIRRKWAPMLSTGTTWEGYEWDEKAGSSCSHAWTAHPSYHLVNILVGLKQAAPAWREVRWAPLLAKGIDQAEAVVPTPQGLLKASWRKQGRTAEFRIEVPAGVVIVAELPGLKRRIAQPGVHEFQTGV